MGYSKEHFSRLQSNVNWVWFHELCLNRYGIRLNIKCSTRIRASSAIDGRVFGKGGGVEAKYPRLRSEKTMTAYLGYEVDVLKKKKKNDYCRVSTGFRLIPKGN